MINERPQHLVARLVLLTAFVFFISAEALSADLKPETITAFNHYVELSEQCMRQESSPESFLRIDIQRIPNYDERLRKGEILTNRLETLDHDKPIPVPDGLIHHWMGTIFIPGATLSQVLVFLQDYDNQFRSYSPDVESSKLLEHKGDHFRVFLRLRRTEIVTVVLNTEYDVNYTRLDATHAVSSSYSTRIAEVENAGRADEHEKPVGHDSGLMWRLNSYWRFEQKDGGTYVQLEALSLTRDIPTVLGWLIRPFVTSIPQQSIEFTLTRTRDALNRSR